MKIIKLAYFGSILIGAVALSYNLYNSQNVAKEFLLSAIMIVSALIGGISSCYLTNHK